MTYTVIKVAKSAKKRPPRYPPWRGCHRAPKIAKKCRYTIEKVPSTGFHPTLSKSTVFPLYKSIFTKKGSAGPVWPPQTALEKKSLKTRELRHIYQKLPVFPLKKCLFLSNFILLLYIISWSVNGKRAENDLPLSLFWEGGSKVLIK